MLLLGLLHMVSELRLFNVAVVGYCLRLVIHAGFRNYSTPLDGIPEGMGEQDTGALMDLGTVVLSPESSRPPSTGL